MSDKNVATVVETFRLKVARTIADLAGDDHLKANHVAEAIQYRTIDRMQ